MVDERASETARTIGAMGPWAVAALIGAGVVSDGIPPTGAAWAFAAMLIGLAVVSVPLATHSRQTRIYVVIGVIAVTAGVAGLRAVTIERGALSELALQGRSAAVLAEVATEPRLTSEGWWSIARVSEVDGARVRERALVRGIDVEPPVLGTRWRATVTARQLGHDGFHGFVRRLHAGTELYEIDGWEAVGPAGPISAASERVRAGLREAADTLPSPHAGIAVGLVTGDRRLLPSATERAMRETGLTHLIVVSGSKVAILAAGVMLLLRVARVSAGWRRLSLVSIISWYVFVSRWEPSVLRAAVMAGVLLAAGRRGTLGDARHALAAAILLLVLVDPGLAGSPGLLLSAGATAGVLVIAPLLIDRARLEGRSGRLLAMTVGAQIGVAAPLLALFGELPVASVPANLIAVPVTAVASIPVFSAAAIAWLDPDLAGPLLRLASPLLGLIGEVAVRLQGWGGHIELSRPTTVVAALSVTAALLVRPGTRLRRVALVAAGLGITVALIPSLVGARPPTELVITAIDVGQGDAFLIESPGARLLVDGGPDDTAARWLRRNGRRNLDLVVATHAHADHVLGLGDVLDRARVGAIWTPEVGIDRPTMAPVLEAAEARGVPIHHPVEGETARVGDVAIEVLGPPPGRPFRWAGSELNDTSVVLRVTWQDRAVLLTGDIEEAAQRRLIGDPRRAASAYTVPHHGAGTSIDGFLAVPGALSAVISAGKGNQHGHPHPGTVEVLRRLGLEVRRTDLEGTVTVTVPPVRFGDPDPGGRGDHAGVTPPSSPRARPRGSAPRRAARCWPRGRAGRRSRRTGPHGSSRRHRAPRDRPRWRLRYRRCVGTRRLPRPCPPRRRGRGRPRRAGVRASAGR